jgi:hypothetical protein
VRDDDSGGSRVATAKKCRPHSFSLRLGDPFFALVASMNAMKQSPTSPYVPDLEELRAWLEQMVTSMKFVQMVIAVVSLIARMRDINLAGC